MKTYTMRSMIAVAALVVAAGSASAQTYKAEIPMAFRAGNAAMAPGSYEFTVVTGSSGYQTFLVRSAAGKTSAILLSNPADAPKAWRQEGSPKIAFACLAGRCTLSRLWNGRDSWAYEFPSYRKLSAAEAEQVAFITVALAKAD